MPRKAKGKHTSPENAGAHNIPAEYVETHKADELTQEIMRKIHQLKEVRKPYKGHWTDEEFEQSVNDYFNFCYNIGLEISRPSLILWLRVDDGQFCRWLRESKYGHKYSVLNEAMKEMEMTYFGKLDSRPVPQMFKLKTQYNYVENQKIEVVAETKVSAEEIRDKVSQMITESK